MTTKNQHLLFIPASPYNTDITATMGQSWMLPSWLGGAGGGERPTDKQLDKQAFCMAKNHSLTIPPAALRSSLSKRNQYPTMIKLIAAYGLAKGPAKFSKETRRRMTAVDHQETAA